MATLGLRGKEYNMSWFSNDPIEKSPSETPTSKGFFESDPIEQDSSQSQGEVIKAYPPALERGDKDNGEGGLISKVQSALSSLGLYSGDNDGVVGNKTIAGVQDYQAQAGFDRTGVIDEGTLDGILRTPASDRIDSINIPSALGSAPTPDSAPVADTTPAAAPVVDTSIDDAVAEALGESEALPEEQGPDFYPSNEGSIKTYARDMFPDNPQAAAALAATIQFEGMKYASEQIGAPGDSLRYRLKGVLTNAKSTPSLKRNDQAIAAILGLPKQKDSDGNILYLQRPSKDVKMSAQEALNAKGFNVGEVDGLIGKNTKAKIKLYQTENKLKVTGKLDEKTLSSLGVDSSEKDHKGNNIPLHVITDADKNKKIPRDKAEAVFDIRYNDHYRESKLGNVGDQEFAKYRGRGPIQITGKDMYKKIGDIIGVDLVSNPSLVATDLDVSRKATKAYLDIKGFANKSPDNMIKLINPGKGDILTERKPAYTKYLKAMK